jgi:hypothetical protein
MAMRFLRRYRTSRLADYLEATAIMCGGLLVIAFLMGGGAP